MRHVVVEQIPDSGRQVTISSDWTWVNTVVEEVTGGTDAVCSGTFSLHQVNRRVTVAGHLSASATCVCERCGEGFPLTVESNLELVYVPSGSTQEHSDRELGENDLDVGWYDEGILNISDVISEALALSLPERLICLEVEGCERRTTALLASARADASTGHPGFASLKDF